MASSMIHPDRILLAVCRAYCVHPEEVWSPSRTRALSHPRMLTAYLMAEHTHLTVEDITIYLNRTNHSTCTYWRKTVSKMLEAPHFQEFVSKIEADISNDDKKSLPSPDLQDRHPILRTGPRHTRIWHRLQWILQCVPQSTVPESCQGEREGGSDPEPNQPT